MDDQKALSWTSEPTQPTKKQGVFSVKNKRDQDGKVYIWSPKRSDKTIKLEALTKTRLRFPQDRYLKDKIYKVVKEVTDQDPFLMYEDENEVAYRIHNHAEEVLVIPKERAIPEPFPVQQPDAIRNAYRFLLWTALGLLLSGLGAVILAPFTAFWAARAIRFGYLSEDRVRGCVILSMAVTLFLLGLVLAYLFWIHWAA